MLFTGPRLAFFAALFAPPVSVVDEEQAPDASPSSADDTPPVITGVGVVGVAPGVAVVSWQTDGPSTSVVHYGLTDAYGSTQVGAPVLVSDHLVVLAGLSIGATYHFQVESADQHGNVATSEDATFVALDGLPPVVSDLAVTQLTQDLALVTFVTNEPALSAVEYGPTPGLGSVYAAPDFLFSHAALLVDLYAGSWYFQVTCWDVLGNMVSTPLDTFQVADVTPPVIGPVAVEAEVYEATLSWETDEPATFQVDYGETTAYGSTVFGGGAPATSHAVQLGDLEPETSYHFAITCTDLAGNASTSPDAELSTGPEPVVPSGTMIAWQPLTLTVQGPFAHELDASPNPFLDYRFAVRFSGPSGQSYLVPGFFDGDGVGGASGDAWRVRFAPDEGGLWTYELFFDQGPEVAIDLDQGAGSPLPPDGLTGEVTIAPVDPAAPGFYKWGLLEYVGEHYLKFRDGPYFLKGGVNSPENLLGCKGFDNTFDQPGGTDTSGLEDGLHRFLPHVGDFGSTGLGDDDDPFFVSADHGYTSEGLIGALNYVASQGLNSVHFLPMNLGGDGRETCPFVGFLDNDFDKTHYDISKLRQWNRVFSHAVRRGILLHVALGETEETNETYLDGGTLGVQRKLFYREMAARFAHHLAIKWTLSEENDFSTETVLEFADYLDAVDPYDHPIGFHTNYIPPTGEYPDYDAVMGEEVLQISAIQCDPLTAGLTVELWREKSAAAGHPWVIETDEIGPRSEGLSPDSMEIRRKRALWDVYLSGGAIEWYMGQSSLPVGGDLTLEDFRTREEMWEWTAYARGFVQEHLPFWEMEPRDELVSGEAPEHGGAEVFAKSGEFYAVYFPDTSATGTIDLTETGATFRRSWFDPLSGEFVGSVATVVGGQVVGNGTPPEPGAQRDWVLLYEFIP